MNRTIARYGACFTLTLNDKSAEELTREVNRLFNFGIISKVPESFVENKDTSVTVLSDEGRMTRGYIAIGLNKYRAKLPHHFPGKRIAIKTLAEKFAFEKIASYRVTENIYENPQGGAYIFQQGAINSNRRDSGNE